jgi:hypothetical protein
LSYSTGVLKSRMEMSWLDFSLSSLGSSPSMLDRSLAASACFIPLCFPPRKKTVRASHAEIVQ